MIREFSKAGRMRSYRKRASARKKNSNWDSQGGVWQSANTVFQKQQLDLIQIPSHICMHAAHSVDIPSTFQQHFALLILLEIKHRSIDTLVARFERENSSSKPKTKAKPRMRFGCFLLLSKTETILQY